MTQLRVSRLSPDDLRELRDMLAASNLPVADLTEAGKSFFRFDDGAGLVGYGGLEGEGPDRLLRSVLIVDGRRGHGLGRSVLILLEEAARDLRVQRLHLLTDAAATFFRANGYADALRTSAPAPIAASREFASLCPASASYLVKVL